MTRLTFSTSLQDFPSAIAQMISLTEVEIGEELEAIIESNGFIINKNKVRLQPKYRRQEVTGLTVNEFPNVRRNYVRQIRAMLHAWDKFGIANAEKDYFLKYNKNRNPDLELPSFRQIVKGKIEFLGMVRGKKNAIYCRYIEKYKVLYSRDKGVPGLSLASLRDLGKPQIYVEGKTDRAILFTAWNKLYENAHIPFVIKDSDPIRNSHSRGGSGGALALQGLLNSHRAETSYIVIGVFDRDKAGRNAYGKLYKDYREDATEEWKITDERRAGAMLLPVPDGKEKFDYYQNLCIEFYFSEEVLSQKSDDGLGLEFSNLPITIDGIKVTDDEQKQIPEKRIIRKGKREFANSIVPSLDGTEFESFRELFEKIIKLIKRIQNSDQFDPE